MKLVHPKATMCVWRDVKIQFPTYLFSIIMSSRSDTWGSSKKWLRDASSFISPNSFPRDSEQRTSTMISHSGLWTRKVLLVWSCTCARARPSQLALSSAILLRARLTMSEMKSMQLQSLGQAMANESFNSTEESTSLDSQSLHQAAVMLWQVMPPVVLVCWTFGNVMTIVVMRGTRAAGQSSACMPVYFTALAVSDLLALTIGLSRHWAIHMFGFDFRLLSDIACKIHSFLVHVFGQTSCWFLVVMTSQRVASVAWPLKVCLQSTRKKALLTVSLVVCMSLLLNSGILFFFSIVRFRTSEVCSIAQTDSNFRYRSVFVWWDLATLSVIPFCVISTSNILLVWKVTRSVRAAKNMTETGRANTRARKASSLSVTIVITSAAFLVFTLPISAFSLSSYTQKHSVAEDIHSMAKISFAYAACILLWYCNCSINFYLYCLSGTKFRNEAKDLLMSLLLKCNLRQV